ncbi:redoxin domain-containing protein [Streptomyces sp. PG2]
MTTTPIADQVADLREKVAEQLPADALKVFGAEQAELAVAEPPSGIAEPGTPMPDASLLDVRGRPVTLDQARAGRPAVVVFYRGAWCPYCNLALRTYQRELVAELDERGVVMIAVSPQKPTAHSASSRPTTSPTRSSPTPATGSAARSASSPGPRTGYCTRRPPSGWT